MTYGLDLMLAVFRIVQGMVSTIITHRACREHRHDLPQKCIDKINVLAFGIPSPCGR